MSERSERLRAIAQSGSGGSKKDDDGFLGNLAENIGTITDMPMTMFEGLPGFAGAAAQTVAGVGRLPGTFGVGLARALPGPAGDAAEAVWDSPFGDVIADKAAFGNALATASDGEGNAITDTWDVLGDTAPLVTDLPESFVQTGKRNLELWRAISAGGNPWDDYSLGDTQYAQAFEEGQLPWLMAEDIGNASIVAAGTGAGVGSVSRAATRAAAGEATSGVSGALGRAVARRTPQSIPHLEAASTKLGTAAQAADKIANPFAWPGQVARPVLRQTRFAPVVEEAGRGSLVHAALKSRLPRYEQFWTRRANVSEGMGRALDAQAHSNAASQEAVRFLSDHADTDPVAGGAAVAFARDLDADVVRKRVHAPVVDDSGAFAPPSREVMQQRLDEITGSQAYDDPKLKPKRAEKLREQQNITVDEFELMERFVDGDEAAAHVGLIADEMVERVLDDKAASRLNASGERLERHHRFDEVPDEVGVDDVVAARRQVAEVKAARDEAAKRSSRARAEARAAVAEADRLRKEADDLDAAADVIREDPLEHFDPDGKKGMTQDAADAKAFEMLDEARRARHAASTAHDEAVAATSLVEQFDGMKQQADADLAESREWTDAVQQKAGRKEEQGSGPMETYVERDVDNARQGQTPRDGMDVEIHGELAALRQQAIDDFGVDPDYHGLRDHDPGQMVDRTIDEWDGAEFQEMIGEAADDGMRAWAAEWADTPEDMRPRRPSRAKMRNDAMKALAGEGRLEIHAGNIPGEWVEVLPSQVTWSDLPAAGKRVRVKERVPSPSSMADDVATWQRQWDDAVQKLREKPENLPPQVRRMREQQRRAAEGLRKDADRIAEDFPAEAEALYAMVDEGIEALDEIVQNLSGGAQVSGGTLGGGLGGSATGKAQALGNEHQLGSVEAPNSLEGQVQLAVRRKQQQSYNDAQRVMVDDLGVKQVADEVWETPGGERMTRAELEAEGMVEHDVADLGLRVSSVEDAVLPPGRGKQTVWLPDGLMDGFTTVGTDIFEGTRASRALKVYDDGMGLWKAGVLALSPRWHLGNILGNMAMAYLGAGVTPLDLFTMRHEIRTIAGSPLGHRRTRSGKVKGRAADAGGDPTMERMLSSSNVDEMTSGTFLAHAADKEGGRLRQAGRTLVDGSFRLNQWVDNVSHISVALKGRQNRARALGDLDRQLARKEISQEAYDTRRAALDLSDEAIAQDALRVAGDFQRMTPFERGVVRRAMPFYAWYKHITKLTFSLPKHNPTRLAWTLHLSEMYANDEERPGWMQGMLGVGGDNYLQVSMLNPFGGASSDMNPLLNPSKALGASTPLLQVPLNAFNIDTRQGGFLSHAPGHGPVNEDGNETAGFVGWDVLARQATDLNPITRLARGTIEEPVARYDSGQPVLMNGRPVEQSMRGGRLAPLASYLGVTVHEVDVDRQNRRTRERLRDRDKSRRTYDRQRSRSGV